MQTPSRMPVPGGPSSPNLDSRRLPDPNKGDCAPGSRVWGLASGGGRGVRRAGTLRHRGVAHLGRQEPVSPPRRRKRTGAPPRRVCSRVGARRGNAAGLSCWGSSGAIDHRRAAKSAGGRPSTPPSTPPACPTCGGVGEARGRHFSGFESASAAGEWAAGGGPAPVSCQCQKSRDARPFSATHARRDGRSNAPLNVPIGRRAAETPRAKVSLLRHPKSANFDGAQRKKLRSEWPELNFPRPHAPWRPRSSRITDFG